MYLRQKCVADYCRYDSDYGKGKTQVGQNIQHLFIFLHTKQPDNHLISTVPDSCMNGCRPYKHAGKFCSQEPDLLSSSWHPGWFFSKFLLKNILSASYNLFFYKSCSPFT